MPDDYTGHMLMQVLDEMKTVHELVAEVSKIARKLEHVEQDVAELKQDMKVVRAATTDTNHRVHDLERRVSRLEAA